MNGVAIGRIDLVRRGWRKLAGKLIAGAVLGIWAATLHPGAALAEQHAECVLSEEAMRNARDALQKLNRDGGTAAQKEAITALERCIRENARDLSELLNNLRMARPGQQGEGNDELDSALNQLGDIIRRQQQLRDRTFEKGQNERRQQGQRGQKGQQGQQGEQGQKGQGQQGQQGDDGQDDAGDLRNQQQALREQLDKLLDELRQKGLGRPGQQGEQEMQQLGRAGKEMGEAEGQLGKDDTDGAVDSQGRALEALRRGAQDLAQSMQQDQMGEGPGQQGQRGRSRAQRDTDPLGRPMRGRWDDSTLPNTCLNTDDPRCFPARRRAEEILNELRRRFGENNRPQLELDYIERLLRDVR